MKTATTFLILFVLTISLGAQTTSKKEEATISKLRCEDSIGHDNKPLYVLDGSLVDEASVVKISPKNIASISILKNQEAIDYYGAMAVNGVVVLKTNGNKEEKCEVKTYPFKVYSFKNTNWVLKQDIFNALEGQVPSLRITNRNGLGSVPNFNIRGDDNTIIIVDGIRYDASILNSLNPADIESIKVAPSIAATNYFRNGFSN